MSFLGVDIGTSACKGLLLGDDGTQHGKAQRSYPLSFPRPGWVELDPGLVWGAVQGLIIELASVGRAAGDAVEALAFSVSGDESVPVDVNGNSLYPCIMAMDTRTTPLVQRWAAEVGIETTYYSTGVRPASNWPLLHLMWLRENEPEVFARTVQFLSWEELMILRLTGRAVTEHSLACRSMAFDLGARTWSRPLLAAADIPATMFPDSRESGVVVGEVTAPLAEQLGLHAHTMVVTGGFDQAMAALGAGLTNPGEAVIGTGTWEALTVLTATPAISRDLCSGGYTSGCYVVPDLYYCMATNPNGGSVLRWFQDTFGHREVQEAQRTGADVFDLILDEMPDQPSNLLALVHLSGSYNPWMDPDSTGALLGLRLSTRRGEVVKALLEGVTFELLENLLRLEKAGVHASTLSASGGGARSRLWLQLKADILGRPVNRIAVEEAGCVAAAALAAVGAGRFERAIDAVAASVRIVGTFEPREAVHAAYRSTFDRYHRLYTALKPLEVGRWRGQRA